MNILPKQQRLLGVSIDITSMVMKLCDIRKWQLAND